MAPHSSTLAWRIPWMEEHGRLQSKGSLRVRHDWATSLSLSTFMHWRGKWQPTLLFLPGESQGQRSLLGAVYGVTQSWTWLVWLSSSSSRQIWFCCVWGYRKGPLAKECRDFTEARKHRKNRFLPWSLQTRVQLCQHLEFNPVRPILDFWPTDCRIINVCCWHHCLW